MTNGIYTWARRVSRWRTQEDDAKLGAGKWGQEPDKLEWTDYITGLECLIVRNPMGALCGYVGVPIGHPWYGLGYSSDWCPQDCPERYSYGDGEMSSCYTHSPESQTRVHGGLTFSGGCQEGGKICHTPADGVDDTVHWFGFDCAHAGDYVPGMARIYEDIPLLAREQAMSEYYRDIEYVKAEVEKLAAQLKAVTA
jgi:hypothetical protein